MRTIIHQTKSVSVPEKIIRKWKEFVNEFEDFLMSQNKDLLKRIRKARKEHKAGKLTDFNG